MIDLTYRDQIQKQIQTSLIIKVVDFMFFLSTVRKYRCKTQKSDSSIQDVEQF